MRPVIALKTRWKWNGLMPAWAASVSSLGAFSEPSSTRQAAVTLAVCSTSSEGWSGLHRLQGRNPDRSASSRVGWNPTCSGRARRAAQDGRQYTPVVRTE